MSPNDVTNMLAAMTDDQLRTALESAVRLRLRYERLMFEQAAVVRVLEDELRRRTGQASP